MPSPVFAKYVTPYQDGALVTFMRYDSRELDIHCELFCDNITILRQRMTAILQAFRPDLGIGTLAITNEQGITRQLRCYYRQGLEGNEPMEWGAGFVGRFILTFVAGDPYWYDPRSADAQTISVTGGAGNTDGGGLKTYTATTTMTNNGTSNAWPIWTITCPHSMTTQSGFIGTDAPTSYQTIVTITNVTTGDYFTITYTDTIPANTSGSTSYPSSDTVRVLDTRPGIKTVTDGSGVPALASLTYQNLFPLALGANSIRLDVVVYENVPGTAGVVRLTEVHHAGPVMVSMTYQPAFLSL